MKTMMKALSVLMVLVLLAACGLTTFAGTSDQADAEQSMDISDISDESGDVSHEETELGDVNGDNEIDMKDVLLLRKYLAKLDVTIVESLSDVNDDESIDMKDVLLLRKYIAGLVSKLGIDPYELVKKPYRGLVRQNLEKNDISLAKFASQQKKDRNFVISPASFDYVMSTLAMAAGNGTATQKEIFDMYGFDGISDFYSYISEINSLAESSFKISNSIWFNKEQGNVFKQEYVEMLKEYFKSDTFSVDRNEMKDTANQWVKDSTDGLIPVLFTEDPDEDWLSSFINAIHVKQPWECVAYSDDRQMDFVTSAGEIVKKDLFTVESEDKDNIGYYKDENTEMVILPTKSNVKVALIMGDDSDFQNTLNKAEYIPVQVDIPIVEIEAELSPEEAMEFCKQNGVETIFEEDSADLSNLTSLQAHVSSVSQKATISLNSTGITAAAVTQKSVIYEAWYEYKHIKFDHAFSFVVYAEEEDGTACTLFYGQINE